MPDRDGVERYLDLAATEEDHGEVRKTKFDKSLCRFLTFICRLLLSEMSQCRQGGNEVLSL